MSRYGMTGFDGGGFALGEVYGCRWWSLREEVWQDVPVPGRLPRMRPVLTGAYNKAWRPGENVAVCGQRRDHRVPDEDCGCGFWGYWLQEDAPITSASRVMGVIKGYGDDTLIGDKGFRCGRAVLVALCCEKAVQKARYEDRTVTYTGPPAGVRWRNPDGAQATYQAFGGRPTHVPVTERVAVYEEDLYAQSQLEARLEEAYGVKVYTTFDAMLAMHPTTKDYLPPPPSGEDISRVIQSLARVDPHAVRHMLQNGINPALPARPKDRFSFGRSDPMMPQTISGTDALKRLALRADFTAEISGDVLPGAWDKLKQMLGLPPESKGLRGVSSDVVIYDEAAEPSGD